MRAEADARLKSELSRVREEGERVSEEAERVRQSQSQAEALRETAAEEARKAQEAAAQALEAEVVRVREEANQRLERELGLVDRRPPSHAAHSRTKSGSANSCANSGSRRKPNCVPRPNRKRSAPSRPKRRACGPRPSPSCARKPHGRAKKPIHGSRTSSPRSRPRPTSAESNELEEVRAQVLRLRTAAAEQARVAAEQAVAVEVARAKSLTPVAPPAPPRNSKISGRRRSSPTNGDRSGSSSPCPRIKGPGSSPHRLSSSPSSDPCSHLVWFRWARVRPSHRRRWSTRTPSRRSRNRTGPWLESTKPARVKAASCKSNRRRRARV